MAAFTSAAGYALAWPKAVAGMCPYQNAQEGGLSRQEESCFVEKEDPNAVISPFSVHTTIFRAQRPSYCRLTPAVMTQIAAQMLARHTQKDISKEGQGNRSETAKSLLLEGKALTRSKCMVE
jgi:hypothetical protein